MAPLSLPATWFFVSNVILFFLKKNSNLSLRPHKNLDLSPAGCNQAVQLVKGGWKPATLEATGKHGARPTERPRGNVLNPISAQRATQGSKEPTNQIKIKTTEQQCRQEVLWSFDHRHLNERH